MILCYNQLLQDEAGTAPTLRSTRPPGRGIKENTMLHPSYTELMSIVNKDRPAGEEVVKSR